MDAFGGPPIDVGRGTSKFSWSPGGRFLAFDSFSSDGTTVMLLDMTSPDKPLFLTEGRHPRWSPVGDRISFVRDDQVYTIRPDGTGLAGLGEIGRPFFLTLAWSEDGQQLEFVRAPSDMPHLYAFDLRDGTLMRTPRPLAEMGSLRGVRLAPNADEIALQVGAGRKGQNAGWYTMDVATGELTQIRDSSSGHDVSWSAEGVRVVSADLRGVFVAESDRSPPRRISDLEANSAVWSPDGTRVAFGSENAIHVLEVDGTDDQVIDLSLPPESGGVGALAWSPDGTRLLYVVDASDSTQATFIASLDGTPSTPLFDPQIGAFGARWAPDGETIAYALNDDAATELWLIDPDGGDQRRLAGFESTNYGIGHLHWSPDGASIAVVVGRNDVYVIDVETGSSLFAATSARVCMTSLLGWSPDGQRLFAVPRCEYQL